MQKQKEYPEIVVKNDENGKEVKLKRNVGRPKQSDEERFKALKEREAKKNQEYEKRRMNKVEMAKQYTEQLKEDGLITEKQYTCDGCNKKFYDKDKIILTFYFQGDRILMSNGIKCTKCH